MKIITSEAVFKGHPDKMCDQISDAILDECLKQDKDSRVAIETLLKNNLVVIAGEITSKAKINYKDIVYKVFSDLGYDNLDKLNIIVEVSEQSPDIALGVDKVGGAGDQGIMYGYACFEGPTLGPLPITIARTIAIQMDEISKSNRDLFGSDGKCQVSLKYNDEGIATKIKTIVVSQQVKKGVERDLYTKIIIDDCIKRVVPYYLMDKDTEILINPTGEFVKGGPYADTGLTGRKIICDTYGGVGRHGGGAFSGKDVSKVDRLAAYYARYVAKNIVGCGLAKKCEIQVGYAIGVAKPVSLNIDTFGTGRYSDEQFLEAINKLFNFSPIAMKNEIIDSSVCFKSLAEYGHVCRTDIDVPWERTNKAHILRAYMEEAYGKPKPINKKILSK